MYKINELSHESPLENVHIDYVALIFRHGCANKYSSNIKMATYI